MKAAGEGRTTRTYAVAAANPPEYSKSINPATFAAGVRTASTQMFDAI